MDYPHWLNEIGYDANIKYAEQHLDTARKTGDTLKIDVLNIICGSENNVQFAWLMNSPNVTSVKEAKTLIAQVKAEAGKGKTSEERRVINKALDDCFITYKKDFEYSLKKADECIARAERRLKLLDGKSRTASLVSSSVKSFFRKQSLENLQRKITDLRAHRNPTSSLGADDL